MLICCKLTVWQRLKHVHTHALVLVVQLNSKVKCHSKSDTGEWNFFMTCNMFWVLWCDLLHHYMITLTTSQHNYITTYLLWMCNSELYVRSQFSWRFSTYRPVARKPEVVAKICWNTSERGSPAAHFGSHPISLRQIIKISCAREISSF